MYTHMYIRVCMCVCAGFLDPFKKQPCNWQMPVNMSVSAYLYSLYFSFWVWLKGEVKGRG